MKNSVITKNIVKNEKPTFCTRRCYHTKSISLGEKKKHFNTINFNLNDSEVEFSKYIYRLHIVIKIICQRQKKNLT